MHLRQHKVRELVIICPCQTFSHLMEKQANSIEFNTKHMPTFTFEVTRKTTYILRNQTQIMTSFK